LTTPGTSKERARAVFGIDVRTLALFRMGLALVVLGDLADRARHLRLMYTDAGVLPRAGALAYFTADSYLSLHMMSGLFWVQACLFGVAALAALALFFGVRTRLATIVSWGLLVSLQTRNWPILHGGDALLRLLLFWSMFLPLGAAYSFDAASATKGEEDGDRRVFSVASVALLLQVCYPYWFATLLRTVPTWWRGEALYYALSLDSLTTPLGHSLLAYPTLLRWLTHSTILLEIGGTSIAFFPFGTRWIRRVVVPSFWLLHLGIALTLQIGIFPWVSIASWLAFLPADVAERIASRFSARFSVRFAGVKRAAAALAERLGLPGVPPLRASLANQLTSGFFLAYITIWNLCWLPYLDVGRYFPQGLISLGQMLQVEQHWNLFAPAPLTRDGWFVVPGQLRDGKWVDLFRGGRTPTWEKPAHSAALWPNSRWWMFTMRLVEFEGARITYAGFACKSWNERHRGDESLVGLQIFFLYQDTLPNHTRSEVKKSLLWSATCNQPPPSPEPSPPQD
jgi:hypothetical protein